MANMLQRTRLANTAQTADNLDRFLFKCGRHINLALDCKLKRILTFEASYNFFVMQQSEQMVKTNATLWGHPLQRALQEHLAGCGCSPLGRLLVQSSSVSGSEAEQVKDMFSPFAGISSDEDLMLQLGPVHWIQRDSNDPVPEQSCPDAAASSEPDQTLTPRLLIKETENPGFVLVLQERLASCPHRDRLPLSASCIRQFNYHYVSAKKEWRTSQSGPSAAYTWKKEHKPPTTCPDHDIVPCLCVPGWWPSEEFFDRSCKCDWPPEAVRNDIRLFGVHLVPIGAKGSITESIEWRLSFSRAEVLCSWNYTHIQRMSLTFFKQCRKLMAPEGKAIKSYYAKTSLLWLCQETGSKEWKSVVEGVNKILDYLEDAVVAGCLPCFFWTSINLFRSATQTELKDMRNSIVSIRQNFIRLLAKDQLLFLNLLSPTMRESGHAVSKRQLRICLARSLIVEGVTFSCCWRVLMQKSEHLKHYIQYALRLAKVMDVVNVLGHFIRLTPARESLFHAMSVAPADVAARMRLTSSGDGGFVWDAAPLMELLTTGDKTEMLGDPDAVRAWLRRQQQVPLTERPSSLPLDLRSPRDYAALLSNTPLLVHVLSESVPGWLAKTERDGQILEKIHIPSRETMKSLDFTHQKLLALHDVKHFYWFADYLHSHVGMDRDRAWHTAAKYARELAQICVDPNTRAEYDRITTSLPDSWQLRKFALGS